MSKSIWRIHWFTDHDRGMILKLTPSLFSVFIRTILPLFPFDTVSVTTLGYNMPSDGSLNVRAKSRNAIWWQSAPGWGPFAAWSIMLWTKYCFYISSSHFYYTFWACCNPKAREAVNYFKCCLMFPGNHPISRSLLEEGESLFPGFWIRGVPGSTRTSTGNPSLKLYSGQSDYALMVCVQVGRCQNRKGAGVGGSMAP